MAIVALLTVKQVQEELAILKDEVPYLQAIIGGGTSITPKTPAPPRIMALLTSMLAEKKLTQERYQVAYDKVMNSLPDMEVEIEE